MCTSNCVFTQSCPNLRGINISSATYFWVLLKLTVNIYIFAISFMHPLRMAVNGQIRGGIRSESIGWFIKNHANSPSYDLAPPPTPSPPPMSVSSTRRNTKEDCRRRDRGGGGGMGRSQIKRWRSLGFYKSFNILWCRVFTVQFQHIVDCA